MGADEAVCLMHGEYDIMQRMVKTKNEGEIKYPDSSS